MNNKISTPLVDEDKIATEPVIMTNRTDIEFGNIELGVNEQGEIVLSPDKPMRRPTIYMSCQGSEILVEDIFHGRTALARQGHWPVELFKMGHQLDVTVTPDEPIKILVVNLGPERSSVGASLVATPPEDEGAQSAGGRGGEGRPEAPAGRGRYHLKGEGTKEGTP
jgi:hypothetical protein